MRLIDADAFEKEMNEQLLPKLIEKYGAEEALTGLHFSFRDLINNVVYQPEVKPQMQWIPCSERLPEVDEDGYSDKMLVCFNNYSGCEICEYRIIDGAGKWYVGDFDDAIEDIGVKVSAWMPLPERYRGDKREKGD